MNLLEESDMEYPLTVSVSRAIGSYDDAGNYAETTTSIIEHMQADIQLSLKLRQFTSEDKTGLSDKSVWIMYCVPPAPISEGDRVTDRMREFFVEAVGDWGSHVECVMRRKE
jgi:hypothetical protein